MGARVLPTILHGARDRIEQCGRMNRRREHAPAIRRESDALGLLCGGYVETAQRAARSRVIDLDVPAARGKPAPVGAEGDAVGLSLRRQGGEQPD